jgi:hypothetical protein
MPVAPDFNTISHALHWQLAAPGSIVEVRTIEQYRGRSSVGYFNDAVVAANAVVNNDHGGLAGTYVTINPVHPDAFARCSNRMMSGSAGMFTKDKEIIERRGLLLDFDPKRLSGITGISSTDTEHQMALDRMREVTWDLTQFHGFPVPCLIDSGNGGHGKYMLDPMPNDDESTDLVRSFLLCLHHRYGSEWVDIDRTVFNASRIVRIPGTPARKGEDTATRPHRVSRLIQDFDPLDTLPRKTLERFVALYGHLIPDAQRSRSVDPLRAKREYPADEALYRTLNRVARDRFHEWTAALIPELARPSGDGYRIDSDALGRDLEEAISIGPKGIVDFGVADMGDATQGRRTPISLLAEVLTEGDKRRAATLLSTCLNYPATDFDSKPIVDEPLFGKPPTAPLLAAEPIAMPGSLMGSPGFARPSNAYRDVDVLNMERTKWLLPDFLIQAGYTIVTAATKMGKSTLTKQMIAALLTGTPFLGSQAATKCEVLYVAYEDMKNDMLRDIRGMLATVLRANHVPEQDIQGEMQIALKGLHFYAREVNETGEFFHRVPTGREGMEYMTTLIRSELPFVKAACIDPIRLLTDETQRSRNIVTQQYLEGLDFLNLAVKSGCAVWGLHHSNKESGKKSAEGNDPLLAAGGTAAITGSAQNIIVFEGDRIPKGIDGATGLYIVPRIEQTRVKVIKFFNGAFYLAPPDTEIYYHRNQSKNVDPNLEPKILQYLEQYKAGTSAQMAATLNCSKYHIEKRLMSLQHSGVVDTAPDETQLYYVGRGSPAKIWFLTKAKIVSQQV